MYWLRDCLQTSLHLVCVDNQNAFKYLGFQHYIIKDMYTERMKHGFENYSEMSQKSELIFFYQKLLRRHISKFPFSLLSIRASTFRLTVAWKVFKLGQQSIKRQNVKREEDKDFWGNGRFWRKLLIGPVMYLICYISIESVHQIDFPWNMTLSIFCHISLKCWCHVPYMMITTEKSKIMNSVLKTWVFVSQGTCSSFEPP